MPHPPPPPPRVLPVTFRELLFGSPSIGVPSIFLHLFSIVSSRSSLYPDDKSVRLASDVLSSKLSVESQVGVQSAVLVSLVGAMYINSDSADALFNALCLCSIFGFVLSALASLLIVALLTALPSSTVPDFEALLPWQIYNTSSLSSGLSFFLFGAAAILRQRERCGVVDTHASCSYNLCFGMSVAVLLALLLGVCSLGLYASACRVKAAYMSSCEELERRKVDDLTFLLQADKMPHPPPLEPASASSSSSSSDCDKELASSPVVRFYIISSEWSVLLLQFLLSDGPRPPPDGTSSLLEPLSLSSPVPSPRHGLRLDRPSSSSGGKSDSKRSGVDPESSSSSTSLSSLASSYRHVPPIVWSYLSVRYDFRSSPELYVDVPDAAARDPDALSAFIEDTTRWTVVTRAGGKPQRRRPDDDDDDDRHNNANDHRDGEADARDSSPTVPSSLPFCSESPPSSPSSSSENSLDSSSSSSSSSEFSCADDFRSSVRAEHLLSMGISLERYAALVGRGMSNCSSATTSTQLIDDKVAATVAAEKKMQTQATTTEKEGVKEVEEVEEGRWEEEEEGKGGEEAKDKKEKPDGEPGDCAENSRDSESVRFSERPSTGWLFR